MPSIHFVVIGSQYFVVARDDLDAVRGAVLDAVREGGAFLPFGENGSRVEVLVTASTPVRFEHSDGEDVEVADDRSAPDQVGLVDLDVEWWLESK